MMALRRQVKVWRSEDVYSAARVLLMISRNSGLMDAPPTRKPDHRVTRHTRVGSERLIPHAEGHSLPPLSTP